MENPNEIQEKFPFLTAIRNGTKEYIGIVQNSDEKIITFYDISIAKTEDDKKKILELADCWWWNSNRKIPINIFIGKEMKVFKYCLKTITRKDTDVLFGPVTSLTDLLKKRIKRRQIQLIKKMP